MSFFAMVLVTALMIGLLPTVELPTAAIETVSEATPASDFRFHAATGTIEEYIGSAAEVVIPEDINGVKVTTIGYHAFSYRTSLTSVTIPDSVTEIKYSAFEGCTSLTNVTIPDSVTEIGHSAFYDCTSLTSVTIPDNVTRIRESAFFSCTSLTSVTIPNSVTTIDDYAFTRCSSLTEINVAEKKYRLFFYRWCTFHER